MRIKSLLVGLILLMCLCGCSATRLTYDDLAYFLQEDKTNELDYTDDFKCFDFARALYYSAQGKGIECGIVFISYEDKEVGHALNVFNTVDKGIVFIDCSAGYDGEANLEVGGYYTVTRYETTDCGGSATIALGDGIISSYKIIWNVDYYESMVR